MKEPAHSLDELLDLLGRRSFIMWMIGQGILVGVILVVAKLIKMTSPRTKHKPGKRLARGMAYGCIRLVSRNVVLAWHTWCTRR